MLSPADRALVGRDIGLPGLATVLDPQASAQVVAAVMPNADLGPATVQYVRYKPGASCLTGIRFATPRGGEYFTLKALSRDADDKWSKAARDDRGLVHAEQRIVVRRFPSDGDLRGPRWLMDAATRAGALNSLGLPGCELDVLAYKPERRLVVCARDRFRPVAVVKCYEKTGYARSLAAHQALARTTGLAVTSASAWHDRRCTIASPWVEGRVLDVPTDPLWLFERVGEELARLHNATLDLTAPAGAVAELASLRRLTHDVAHWLPEEATSIQRLVARLDGPWAEVAVPVVPIHGDFYAQQVLVNDRGVTFLDFDECALGDPHADLALFAAHVERDVVRGDCDRVRADLVLDALLSGYRRHRVVDAGRLAWRTAEAILRLTPHPFRHRYANWPLLTRRLIARAGDVLDAPPAARRADASLSGAVIRLRADAALAFSASLLEPAVATHALGDRKDHGDPGAVTVTQATLLRHKPGRRCLIAFEVVPEGSAERWLGKVRAKGTDTVGAAVHRMLWNAGARNIVEPLGMVPSCRMTLQRAAPGVSCLSALNRGDDPRATAGAIAEALHELHTLPVSPRRGWLLHDELTLLHDRLQGLRDREPRYGAAVARLERRLVEIARPLRQRTARAVVHRDFYHDQVLLAGSRCTIVDLDLVATGDPALDLGNFVAHLVELDWRGGVESTAASSLARCVVAAYGALAPSWVTEDAVTRYAYLTLGRLIEIATHHDDRRAHLPMLIDTLDACLARDVRPHRLSLLTERPQCHVA